MEILTVMFLSILLIIYLFKNNNIKKYLLTKKLSNKYSL